MPDVALITTSDVTLTELEGRLVPNFDTYRISASRFGIKDKARVGWIEEESEASGDAAPYTPEELAPLGINKPKVFLLLYEGRASNEEYMDFLRRALILIADDERIWVDNDNRELIFMPGPEVVARLRREPSWNLDMEERRP